MDTAATPKITLVEFKTKFAELQKDLWNFLSPHKGKPVELLTPCHIQHVYEFFQTVEWTNKTAVALHQDVETWLSCHDDTNFFSVYRALVKPRENLELAVAINTSCGMRLSRMWQIAQAKNVQTLAMFRWNTRSSLRNK